MFKTTEAIKKREEAAPTVISDRSSDRSIGTDSDTDSVSEKPSLPGEETAKTVTEFLKKYGLPLLLFAVLTLFFWVLSTFGFTGGREESTVEIGKNRGEEGSSFGITNGKKALPN